MATKSVDRELYGPSVTEVALGAVLGLLAGVLLACVYLVFKPVSQVKELPKEPLRSVTYYIPGSESSAKSRGWQAKQKQFLAGTSISVVEDELNAWAVSVAAPAPKAPAAGKPDEAKSAPEGLIIPYTPNFKVVDGKLQIGLKCKLNWFGLTYDTTAIATGGFAKSGDKVEFVPDKFYLGSCPLHLLPGISGVIASYVTSKEKVPDEVRSAWAKLTEVTIEGGAVKLTVQ